MPVYRRGSTVTSYSGGVLSSRCFKSGWVCKDENPLPALPYTIRIDTSKPNSLVPHRAVMGTEAYATLSDAAFTADINLAAQKAYARFVGECVEGAELALFFAERREAAELMLHRLVTLKNAFQALRKGQFGKFLKALKIRPKPEHRSKWSRPKDASSLWLEYWFGWSPMISDIYAAIAVIESPYPASRIRASALVTARHYYFRAGTSGRDYQLHRWSRVSYMADVVMVNPLLYRANQLGVINPATVVWALVPFSFVIDWFIPVGRFLNTPTDFVGLDVTNREYTEKRLQSGTEKVGNFTTGILTSSSDTMSMSFRRTLGFQRPRLVNGFRRLSLTRAATAASLLVSIFTKG